MIIYTYINTYSHWQDKMILCLCQSYRDDNIQIQGSTNQYSHPPRRMLGQPNKIQSNKQDCDFVNSLYFVKMYQFLCFKTKYQIKWCRQFIMTPYFIKICLFTNIIKFFVTILPLQNDCRGSIQRILRGRSNKSFFVTVISLYNSQTLMLVS